jgi:hypothetical protein
MYWWVIVFAVQDLVQRVEETFAAVQGLNTLVSEQRDQFRALARDLRLRSKVRGPLTVAQKAEAATLHTLGNAFLVDDYVVDREDVLTCFDDLGSFVITAMDSFDDCHKNLVVSTYAFFALDLLSGIAKIVVERDNSNRADEEISPVLPVDIINFNPRAFCECLQRHKDRLILHYGVSEYGTCRIQV